MKRLNSSPILFRSQGVPGKQAGLSLIELMIASVIGLVLLSGVVAIFSSSTASSRMTTGMARVMDSGGAALDIVSFGLRMAGYQGCRDEAKEPVIVLASSTPTITTATLSYPDNAVWGSEVNSSGVWSPARHADLSNIVSVKPNTDVLYIQYGSGKAIGLEQEMTDSGSNIVLPENPGQLRTDDLVMISDCNVANLFRATNVSADTTTGITTIQHAASGNSHSTLSRSFPGDDASAALQVEVMKFEAIAYFVADNGRDLPNGDPLFSLFGLDTSTDPIGTPVELVEGVEDLQVLYGINTQIDDLLPQNIRYVTAENVVNPAQIVSVQLGMIVATADYSAYRNDTRTYNIAGHRVGPSSASGLDGEHGSDRRLRAAFNSTVQIRNRL